MRPEILERFGELKPLVEIIESAPVYQPIPVLPDHESHDFTQYLLWRNKQCKRTFDRGIVFSKIRHGAKVLDLGCNIGYFGLLGNNSFDEYLGIDSDHSALNAAGAIAKHRGYSLQFAHDDIPFSVHQLKEAGKRFDAILYLSTHHHLLTRRQPAEIAEMFDNMSKISPVLIFSMGQSNEPTNPSRTVWHDIIEGTDPKTFPIDHICESSDYNVAEIIGESYVSRSTVGRLLFKFSTLSI